MKKIFSILTFCFATIFALMAADGAAIKFNQTKHDFGTIHADGGEVSCEYTFTNTGSSPLVIISVSNGGCGCTTPTFTKEPVAPGKTGTITIHFNPAGRKGEFNRVVQVKTNASKKRESLRFSGVIVP